MENRGQSICSQTHKTY